MLTLAQASSYFDRTEIRDPDTGALLFLGQIDPFDDAKRDAGGAYRRVLSVAPDKVIPAHRALRAHGQVWLVGVLEVDGLEAQHRNKYVLQSAPTKFNISRLPQFLTAAVAASAWGVSEWVKDGRELEVSSRAVPIYDTHFAASADVREYDVVWSGPEAFLITSVNLQASGFKGAHGVKLEFTPVDATLGTRTYDPVAGAYSAPASTTVRALQVRWQSLFLYGSEADEKYKEGDCSLVLPSGSAPTTADTLTVSGKTWRLLAVETLGGATVVHGRPG